MGTIGGTNLVRLAKLQSCEKVGHGMRCCNFAPSVNPALKIDLPSAVDFDPLQLVSFVSIPGLILSIFVT